LYQWELESILESEGFFDERILSMKRKNHSPEQIVRMLQQADVTVAQGGTVEQACRELGISEGSSWRIHDR